MGTGVYEVISQDSGKKDNHEIEWFMATTGGGLPALTLSW